MLNVAAMFEANLMESTCLVFSGMAVTAAAEPRSGTSMQEGKPPVEAAEKAPRAGYRRRRTATGRRRLSCLVSMKTW
jgi:hypothetical protein